MGRSLCDVGVVRGACWRCNVLHGKGGACMLTCGMPVVGLLGACHGVCLQLAWATTGLSSAFTRFVWLLRGLWLCAAGRLLEVNLSLGGGQGGVRAPQQASYQVCAASSVCIEIG